MDVCTVEAHRRIEKHELTISLECENGTLTLSGKFAVFDLSAHDRNLIYELTDKMRAYDKTIAARSALAKARRESQ